MKNKNAILPAIALVALFAPLAFAADPKADAKQAPPPATSSKTPPVSDEAKKHFKAGVDFLQDPDGARYEEAYREFKEAYRISPSWKILSNLGLAALKLERLGESIDAYEKYLSEGGKDIEPGERAQIEKDLRLSKASSHALVLRAGAKGEVTITDERIRTTGGPVVNAYTIAPGKELRILVVAGQHVVTARADGKAVKWETTLTAEKASDHAFSFDDAKPAPAATSAAPGATSTTATLDPSTAKGSTLRTAGFVTAGVGGALLVGSIFTGLSAKSKESDLSDACPDKTRCPKSNKDTADSAKKMANVTNVLLIGGTLLVGAGVTLVIVGKPKSSDAAQVRLAPAAGPGGAGGVLYGQF